MGGLPKVNAQAFSLADAIYKAQSCPDCSEESLKWAQNVFEKRPITIFFGDRNTPGSVSITLNEIGEIITREDAPDSPKTIRWGCKVETLAHIAYDLLCRIRRNNPIAKYPRWGFRSSEKIRI